MPAKQMVGLYSPSGVGKTSLLGTFVEGYHKANSESIIRLVTAESAQTPALLRRHLEGKYLQMWAIDNSDFPFERITDAVSGAWPEDADDPRAKAIPAFTYAWVATCPLCSKELYRAATAPKPGIAIPACKCQPNQPAPVARCMRKMNEANGIHKVGAYLFEGGTAFGEMMMDRMATLTAQGEKIGGDAAVKFSDGDYKVGGSTQNHYGTSQRQIKQKVQESRQLPVDYVIWTFTKEMGEDEYKRVPVCGPKLPGNAATADAPRWFGPMLSMSRLDTNERRLYLESYKEEWNELTKKYLHIVNSRIPPDALKVATKMWPKGVPEYMTFAPDNKTLFYDVLAEIERRQLGVFDAEQVKVPEVATVGK